MGSLCRDGRRVPGKTGVEGGRCADDGGAKRGVAWKRWLLAKAGGPLPGVCCCEAGGLFERRNRRGVGVCHEIKSVGDSEVLLLVSTDRRW